MHRGQVELPRRRPAGLDGAAADSGSDAGPAAGSEDGVDVPDLTPAVTAPTEAPRRVPPSRRAGRRAPPVREVVSPLPRASGVELGANAAAIIVD